MNNNPPDKPSGDAPGGGSSSFSGTREAVVTITESIEIDDAEYSSENGGENVVLVSGGEALLPGLKVSKTGDESSEDSDFYGTNAAVLATSGTLTLSGGSVETNASHANAVFAYGSGKIIAENLSIKTSANNSGGIMVTGGGTLTATNLTVETSGNSSAAIRSDRGGGTMKVSGGTFETSGTGSPAIYSTADISVGDGAKLVSTASEGVVIEGSNSVSLENVSLTATNNTLNGNSETYKNIFIYQSMSGDAEEGTGSFSAKNSLITTNQGDTFFITNTTAKISLSGNKFINNDKTGVFLRAASGKWGTSGKNGGNVDLALNSQVVEGDVVLDSISSLSFLISTDSYYKGTINGANSAASVSLELDASSTFVLTGDSYLSSLKNASSSNENIYANGYNLYVAGEKVSINESSEIPAVPEVVLASSSEEDSSEETDCIGAEGTDCIFVEESATASSLSLPLIISLSVCGVLILGLIIFAVLKLRKKSPKSPEVILPPTPETPSTPPSSPPETPQTPEISGTPPTPETPPENPFKS